MLKRLSWKRYISIERSQDATFLRLKNVQIKFKRHSIEYTKVLSHTVYPDVALPPKTQQHTSEIKSPTVTKGNCVNYTSAPSLNQAVTNDNNLMSKSPTQTTPISLTRIKPFKEQKTTEDLKTLQNDVPYISTLKSYENEPPITFRKNISRLTQSRKLRERPLRTLSNNFKPTELNSKKPLPNLWDEDCIYDSMGSDFSQFNCQGMRPTVLEYLAHAKKRDPNLF